MLKEHDVIFINQGKERFSSGGMESLLPKMACRTRVHQSLERGIGSQREYA
jgi:hypothetical protein